MSSEAEYECAISGLTAEAVEEESEDSLSDMPVGWTKITIQTRQINAKWSQIQELKEAMTEGLLQQVPEEYRELQRPLTALQVEATLHSLEADTPMYETIEDVVYVSDSEDVVSALNEIRATLGLEAEEA
jgi:DNA-binding transcriptional regulator WhiA